jgi:hypothetical protein
MTDIAERIRSRAYILWEQAGRPQARSDEFWYKAHQELAAGATAESEPVDDLFHQPPAEPAPQRHEPAAAADAGKPAAAQLGGKTASQQGAPATPPRGGRAARVGSAPVAAASAAHKPGSASEAKPEPSITSKDDRPAAAPSGSRERHPKGRGKR